MLNQTKRDLASQRNHCLLRSRQTPNRGIVLLVVLGMLSLFTVLVVSFLVFSSQSAESSFANQQARQDEVLPKPPVQSVISQLMSGTTDSRSAAYGASLLEDLYGVDGLMLRVGHRRTQTTPPSNNAVYPQLGGGQLLLPLNGIGRSATPQTTLFKIPSNLVKWHTNGAVTPPPGESSLSTIATSERTYLDDAYTGRILTFAEGPLRNVPFRVVRYFGDDNGSNDGGVTVSNNAEYTLAGNFVIDLTEFGSETIQIDGTRLDLYEVAATDPNRLLYGPGPDELPGVGSVGTDTFGAPNSDDFGYRFVINGATFNGYGLNPAGVRGIERNGAVLDAFAEAEFTINSRLVGPNFQAVGGETHQPDEAWDAPDTENIFLAWQPSDHRRAHNQAIYGGVDSATLNRQLGQHIIPSFHRPSVINHIMNAPIRLQTDDTDPESPDYFERTFADIRLNPNNASPFFDNARLVELVNRLRRATLRPLNFPHQLPTAAATDLNGDGDPFDGAPGFSGSNMAEILNRPIDFSGGLANVISEIEALAFWLVNGPWDIDNDGDGLPDSVWVDFSLPTIVAPGGQILKPMVAPLIEDQDGKINVNYAGSYNQLVTSRFDTSTLTYGGNSDGVPATTPRVEYFSVNRAIDSFGRGGGIGPAEIDFSHLFKLEPLIPNTFPQHVIGPLRTNQVGPGLNIDQVLRTRYGNLINVRNGGQVYNYTAPYPYASPGSRLASALRFPGAGDRSQSTAFMSEQDLLSRIPFPGRTTLHSSTSHSGRPADMAGVLKVRKDVEGMQGLLGGVPSGDDIINQPYEFAADGTNGDDTPFSPAELVDFVNDRGLNGRLTQLLGDAADRNPALRRLLTTESRSLESPELPGFASMTHLFAEKLAAGGLAQDQHVLHLQRMLGIELKKGAKLNLNRQIANAQNDAGTFVDETGETQTIVKVRSTGPVVYEPINTANNRQANTEPAFPQIVSGGNTALSTQASATASYGSTTYDPTNTAVLDFDGIDRDGDGALDYGTLFDVDGNGMPSNNQRLKMADGAELLARHLYCLMFVLIEDTDAGTGVIVPRFPYPSGFTANATARNNYVARRLAQWAANAVDYRDPDTKCTRLRYDRNPFDANGFNLVQAARNTVWGMEEPELEITETLATHDKRLKRDLPTALVAHPDGSVTDLVNSHRDNDSDPMVQSELEIADDETFDDPGTPGEPVSTDRDMDQFRMPQASAFVELHALRSSIRGTGEGQSSLPGELYDANGRLDLGRTVGTGNQVSPVWRMAVGERTGRDPDKSTRFMFDADRLAKLATQTGNLQDLPNYLNENSTVAGGVIDWTNAATLQTMIDDWRDSWASGADIRVSPFTESWVFGTADPVKSEYVTLADNDFDAADDQNSAARIRLERFVWFSELVPSTALDVISDPRSAMNTNNVYFNRPHPTETDPADTWVPENAAPALFPGQYALVAPRAITHFGQKTSSNAGTNFPYAPSDQSFQIAHFQGDTERFRVDYFRNSVGNIQNPNYRLPADDDNDPTTPGTAPADSVHNIENVIPIVCQSLYPNEVLGAGADAVHEWDEYSSTVPLENQVDMGFNISAPLPDLNYYKAPLSRISTAGTAYPQFDGYRNYDGATGFHPDTPLDHRQTHEDPAGLTARSVVRPLAQNNLEWAAIGTHEEAVTIFLQRLADPTIPWNAIDNPYVTVDFMPMDLTTFNGEHDVREPVNRKVYDGAAFAFATDDSVDDATTWNTPVAPAPNGFTPVLSMDSRRKIPDVEKDRVISVLLPDVASPSTMGDYSRAVVTKRSRLSMTTSVLRESTEATTADYWQFELGSMWNNGVEITTLDTNYGENDTTHEWLSLDSQAAGFAQSLGFVNREYGSPVASNSVRLNSFGIGRPDLVQFMTLPWLNREFQSPHDLMNVPAVSRTELLSAFGPGTDFAVSSSGSDFDDRNKFREHVTPFRHLLGFQVDYSQDRNEDLLLGDTGRGRLALGRIEESNATFGPNTAVLTGDRAGFEQIFDYVDIGPVWFDSKRWFDPAKIQFRQDVSFDTSGNAALILQHELFNRAVETLQPPYNYVGKNRVPGKINLNTMPDYVRKGPNFLGPNNLMFDGVADATDTNPNQRLLYEDPSNPGSFPFTPPVPPSTPAAPIAPPTAGFPPSSVNYLSANPQNSFADQNGFTQEFLRGEDGNGSRLFANGSVYRSLAWGISNPYELDWRVDTSVSPARYRINYGAPSTMGQNNFYETSVDSSFGRAFKALIESRRGYSSTEPGSRGTFSLGNPNLDWRYATQFAGVFAPARAAATPSVQRLMRMEDQSVSQMPSDPMLTPSREPMGVPRRTHDMTLLRPHPDFNARTMSNAQQAAVAAAATGPASGDVDTRFSLNVEFDAATSPTNDAGQGGTDDVILPGLPGLTELPRGTAEVSGLHMSLVNTPMIERPDAELHSSLRNLDRDSFFRHQNVARLSNLTTHHSNVFMVRLTVGYFVVDPSTGAVGREYVDNTGEPIRSHATYLIDRTIPVGFLPGLDMDSERTILYSEVSQ